MVSDQPAMHGPDAPRRNELGFHVSSVPRRRLCSKRSHSDHVRRNLAPQMPLAIEANLVYWFMNASRTVPVGPLRCFAMMISASPRASESGL